MINYSASNKKENYTKRKETSLAKMVLNDTPRNKNCTENVHNWNYRIKWYNKII